MSAKNKLFRDPVHGYIAIDEGTVANFIDTPQFQRLRRIKQTNLDVLFPAANQTRFEHSLGVYFLGRKLFNSILKKADAEYQTELQGYKYTVEMACLLHDIGHAPMAHIGEFFFDKAKLIDELREEGLEVTSDLSPHEMMSVLVSIRVFGDKLTTGGYDKDLFFRLITGALLTSDGCEPVTNLRKAIVQILNSAFDVDKMDYIMRDSSSAGIPSMGLDVDRIINAATLKPYRGGLVLAFGKSGFSVVTAIINNRNYMHKWIYGHHKVQYQCHVLLKFIKRLCEEEYGLCNVFSFEALTGTPADFNGIKISYTDDHDLWHILKNAELPDLFNELRSQLFGRSHYKALWKTEIEFDEIKQDFAQTLGAIRVGMDTPDDFFEKSIKPHTPGIEENDIIMFKHDPKVIFPNLASNMFFYLTDKTTGQHVVKPYKDLFGDEKGRGNEMFHIFVTEDNYAEKYKQIIHALKHV